MPVDQYVLGLYAVFVTLFICSKIICIVKNQYADQEHKNGKNISGDFLVKQICPYIIESDYRQKQPGEKSHKFTKYQTVNENTDTCKKKIDRYQF